jgi:hypothetical protein
MLQTVYSQAAFAHFMHSEASKSFSIDLTNASLVECLTAKIYGYGKGRKYTGGAIGSLLYIIRCCFC